MAAGRIPDGASLTERDLTELLGSLVDDPVTLRRYLVDAGLLSRSADGSAYRRSAYAGAAPRLSLTRQ